MADQETLCLEREGPDPRSQDVETLQAFLEAFNHHGQPTFAVGSPEVLFIASPRFTEVERNILFFLYEGGGWINLVGSTRQLIHEEGGAFLFLLADFSSAEAHRLLAGSSSTPSVEPSQPLLVAYKLGRNYLGFDINSDYRAFLTVGFRTVAPATPIGT